MTLDQTPLRSPLKGADFLVLLYNDLYCYVQPLLCMTAILSYGLLGDGGMEGGVRKDATGLDGIGIVTQIGQINPSRHLTFPRFKYTKLLTGIRVM